VTATPTDSFRICMEFFKLLEVNDIMTLPVLQETKHYVILVVLGIVEVVLFGMMFYNCYAGEIIAVPFLLLFVFLIIYLLVNRLIRRI